MRFIALATITLASLVLPRFAFAASETTFATIEVKLDGDKLAKAAAGVHTLFITIYDEASKAPMPYGAMKVELTKDARGVVYQGKLDSSNVMVMGSGETPKTLRIKAKLDKDGSAGPDASGDVVGIAEHVKVGSTVTVKIDKAIQ